MTLTFNLHLEFHYVVSDVNNAGRALFFQGVTPGLWDAEYVTASCAAAPAGGVAEKCSVPLKCVASTRHRGRDGVGLEESGRGGCCWAVVCQLSAVRAIRNHKLFH